MKKLLLGFMALGMLALGSLVTPETAHAGWNLRQNDDGTTEWVREDTEGSLDTRPVGATYLNVRITDVSTAATFAVPVPVTDAKISYIQGTLLGEIDGSDAVIDFWVADSDGNLISVVTSSAYEVTNGTDPFAFTTSTSTNGIVTFTPTTYNEVEKDHTILIHTDGGSTKTTVADFTITLVPR